MENNLAIEFPAVACDVKGDCGIARANRVVGNRAVIVTDGKVASRNPPNIQSGWKDDDYEEPQFSDAARQCRRYLTT